jgi:hypothetical protein
MEEQFDSKFFGFSSKSFIIFTRNTTSYTGPLVTHPEPFLSLSHPLLTHSATGLPDSSCGSACFNCRHAAALPSLAAEPWGLHICWHLIGDVCWGPHKGCTSTLGSSASPLRTPRLLCALAMTARIGAEGEANQLLHAALLGHDVVVRV